MPHFLFDMLDFGDENVSNEYTDGSGAVMKGDADNPREVPSTALDSGAEARSHGTNLLRHFADG
jgi:hypothetical protein